MPSPLRAATPEDAAPVAALSIEVWLGTYLKQGITPFFADYVLSTFTTAKTAALIDDPNQTIIVSQNQDGIDGFIRLSADTPAPVPNCANLEIATLYVQPRHHGKGIATALLSAAMAHARTQGKPSLWLATNAENTPAIGFYHARGFLQVGETHFSIDDQAFLNNVYRLDLT